MQVKSFQKKVWDFYHTHGRHDLPWRPPQLKLDKKSRVDPYPIVVSEIMLQQTQVSRVIPKFALWMKTFPTFKKLAESRLSQVLTVWQGLGYARRGKYLHQIAHAVDSQKKFPDTIERIEALPGIGHYTARAISTFVYNEPHALIETNIRTVYIHYFFKDAADISDQDILHVVEQTLDKKSPREWMYALMDYGAHLKSQGISYNTRSKTYTKQKPLKGSVREVRGQILKLLSNKKEFTKQDIRAFEKKYSKERTQNALTSLEKDELIVKYKNWFVIK